MKIFIVDRDRIFEVRILDDAGRTTRKFSYSGLQQARRAAAAW